MKHFWLCALALAILSGCSSRPSTQAEFDVPALVGRSIDEVQWVLGTPTNDRLPSAGLDTSCSKTWKKKRVSLIVYYNSLSRRPLFFYLVSETQSPRQVRVEDGTSELALWQLGDLKRDDPSYEAHAVPSLNAPNRLLALKVTPVR